MKYFRAEQDENARLPKSFMEGFLQVCHTHTQYPAIFFSALSNIAEQQNTGTELNRINHHLSHPSTTRPSDQINNFFTITHTTCIYNACFAFVPNFHSNLRQEFLIRCVPFGECDYCDQKTNDIRWYEKKLPTKSA